jgi:uncharacterized protein YcbX
VSFGRVTALYIYPLKGAKGIAVPSARTTPRGFEGDRRFMLVGSDGRFLSQRSHPALALVETALAEGALRVRYEGAELVVPIPSRGRSHSVRIWKDTVEAVVVDGPARKFFTDALGSACELVYMPDEVERPVDPRYATAATDIVSFADGYPYLVATTASLADLEARAGIPLAMNRFRPSLVVANDEPFAEDEWASIALPSATFALVKPCARCTVVTIEQETATLGPEPLRTLAKFRRVGSNVMFGQNAIATVHGEVHVGDLVTPTLS